MDKDDSRLRKTIGLSLYQTRINAGLSRQNVVDSVHISLNALSDIENGKSLVKLDTLQQLSALYRVDAASIVSQSTNASGNESQTNITQDGLKTYLNRVIHKNTRFYIFDAKGSTSNYDEHDFQTYSWNEHQFGKVKPGDVFVYRRPTSASEMKGVFYFFGAGVVSEIRHRGEGNVTATISNPLSFKYNVLSLQLNDYKWHFKDKTRNDWQRFFNQYGMTEIARDDFVEIVSLSGPVDEIQLLNFNTMLNETSAAYSLIHRGIDSIPVTEQTSEIVIRKGQQELAELVKLNYGYSCAVTGIHTRQFLVASHIIPWASKKSTRLNPQNVICLSTLWDRAFDQGFITIEPKTYKIRVSKSIEHSDSALFEQLHEKAGAKIHLPMQDVPNDDFLNWHAENVFRN